MTLLAVLLLIGLVVYIHYFEKDRDDGDTITLYTLSKTEIQSVEMTEGGKSLKIERDQNGTWRLDIDSILAFWSEPQVKKLESSEPIKEFAKFGLEPPEKRLRLTLKTGESKLLRVGKKTAVGWERYLQLEGSPNLYLMPDYRAADLTTDEKRFKAVSAPTQQPAEKRADPSSSKAAAH
ncbi:MAG: DUF4340 domain-containing protein [Deltaproteobacteria bacterium]|nr:DUF4340 domain-containing protein [Deltaproteobacteria bacterium]